MINLCIFKLEKCLNRVHQVIIVDVWGCKVWLTHMAVAFYPQKYPSVTVTDHMLGESFQYLLHATKLLTC